MNEVDVPKVYSSPTEEAIMKTAMKYCPGQTEVDIAYRRGFVDGCINGMINESKSGIGHILRLHDKWKVTVKTVLGWANCPAFRPNVWIKNHWADIDFVPDED